MELTRILWVCVGGAIGTAARYGVSGWSASMFGTAFPWGTLIVNGVGSFILGLIVTVGAGSAHWSSTIQPLIAIGALGAFTTFSTFSVETMKLLQANQMLAAAANVLGTVALCLVAAWLGIVAGRAMGGGAL